MKQKNYEAFVSSFSNDQINEEGKKFETIIYKSKILLDKMKKHLSLNYCSCQNKIVNEGELNNYLFTLGMVGYDIEEFFKKIYFNQLKVKEDLINKNYSLNEVVLLHKEIRSRYSSLSKLNRLKDFIFNNFALIRHFVLHDENFDQYLPENYEKIDVKTEYGDFDQGFGFYDYSDVLNNFIIKLRDYIRRL